MGSNEGGKVVCLTSVSGFSASWLLKLLLLRGYTVKGAVSDPNDSSAVDHLLKLDGAKERLHLFKADLLEEGSFDHAFEGCEGVFHTASPSFNDVKDKQIELLDLIVKGNLNVLKSCAKSPSVKRVILTSSIAAVLYNGRPRTPEVVVDETWFSDPDFLRKNEMWYLLSKTLAEEAAWKFAKENNIDMVALNPGMAIGPLLLPSDSGSFAPLVKLLNGAQTFPNSIMGWSHVKDVANAHIQAFEIPSANGRYCLIEKITHFSEVVEILHHLYPTLQLPDKCENDKPLMPKYQVSKEKPKSLGIEFISFEASLRETVESLKENKLVNF